MPHVRRASCGLRKQSFMGNNRLTTVRSAVSKYKVAMAAADMGSYVVLTDEPICPLVRYLPNGVVPPRSAS